MPSKRAIEDMAYAVLFLEKQLTSYQKLHEEELQALWEALEDLKARVLALTPENMHSEEEAHRKGGES